ncbi:MAG: response regulator transcription factor [Bacillati bacterium ANGP1]|uniref:Response regulator transcription factor n=1 Tax=Candidatus Segetimicrobium genomatis TaxID=2569760 RepID=A0A537J361_9BACT|nr:MAG: response regulator transcription factor [Terrabacteria group bacterium ANGP1]
MTAETDLVTVLIVDPSPIMLSGLGGVLQSDPEIELVGACGTGRGALEVCARAHPSVVVTEVSLPDMSGIYLWRDRRRGLGVCAQGHHARESPARGPRGPEGRDHGSPCDHQAGVR